MKKLAPILSFTLAQLLREVDPNHIHHAEHTAELQEPFLIKAYGSSILFGVYSSKYRQNRRVYRVKVIFKDFFVIARDKEIPIGDAVRYAIEGLDIHVSCDCPAHLYWGYKYMATQLGYAYGLDTERRFPGVNNPKLRGSLCKHADKVMRWIIRNEDTVIRYFEQVYRHIDFSKSLEEYEKQQPKQAEAYEEEKRQADADAPSDEAKAEGSRKDVSLFDDSEAAPAEEQKAEPVEPEAEDTERKDEAPEGKASRKGFSAQSKKLILNATKKEKKRPDRIPEFDFREPFYTEAFQKHLEEALDADAQAALAYANPGDFYAQTAERLRNSVKAQFSFDVERGPQDGRHGLYIRWDPEYPLDMGGVSALPAALIPYNALAALRARARDPNVLRGRATSSYVPQDTQPSAPLWKLKSVEVLKAKLRGPQPGDVVYNMLRNNGVSEEELQETGLSELLQNRPKVSLDEALACVSEHLFELEEVVKKDDLPINTKSPYALPQVLRALRASEARSMDDLVVVLENDTDLYKALDNATKFPELHSEEEGGLRNDWASVVIASLGLSGFEVPRFKQYSTPGGSSYEERLLRYKPKKELPYHTRASDAHWGEEDVLAHTRYAIQRTSDRKSLLLIEEIQSDWHQSGRKVGYGDRIEWNATNSAGRSLGIFPTEAEAQAAVDNSSDGTGRVYRTDARGEPDAPFKKSWPEMVFRRMLVEAVRRKVAYLGWTTGKTQASRYSLSKQVNEVALRAGEPGVYYLVIEDKQGHEVAPYKGSGSEVTPAELAGIVGKEVAAQLVAGADAVKGKPWPKAKKGQQTSNPEFFTLRGLDMDIGGEGMEGFYDEILVHYANKIGKRYGARVEQVTLAKTAGHMDTVEVHALPLTPELQEAFKDSAYLFQAEEASYGEESPVVSADLLGAAPLPYEDHGQWFSCQLATSKDTYTMRGGLQPMSLILRPMLAHLHAPEAAVQITREIGKPLSQVMNFAFEIVDYSGHEFQGEAGTGTVDDPELRSKVRAIFSTAVDFLRKHAADVSTVCVSSAGTANRLSLYKRLFRQAGDFGGRLTKEFEAAGVHFALFEKTPLPQGRKGFSATSSYDFISEAVNFDFYKDIITKSWFDALMELDPTPSGKFGKWIMKLYAALPKEEGIKLAIGKATQQLATSLERAKPALLAYAKLSERKKLPSEVADIMKLSSIDELQAFFASPEGRELVDSLNAKDMEAQRKIIYEDSEWQVWIPLTWEASCFYGKGTEWCTATEKTKDWYDRYVKSGPLIDLLRKSDHYKYQIWRDDSESGPYAETDWEGASKQDKVPNRAAFLLALPDKLRILLDNVYQISFVDYTRTAADIAAVASKGLLGELPSGILHDAACNWLEVLRGKATLASDDLDTFLGLIEAMDPDILSARYVLSSAQSALFLFVSSFSGDPRLRKLAGLLHLDFKDVEATKLVFAVLPLFQGPGKFPFEAFKAFADRNEVTPEALLTALVSSPNVTFEETDRVSLHVLSAVSSLFDTEIPESLQAAIMKNLAFSVVAITHALFPLFLSKKLKIEYCSEDMLESFILTDVIEAASLRAFFAECLPEEQAVDMLSPGLLGTISKAARYLRDSRTWLFRDLPKFVPSRPDMARDLLIIFLGDTGPCPDECANVVAEYLSVLDPEDSPRNAGIYQELAKYLTNDTIRNAAIKYHWRFAIMDFIANGAGIEALSALRNLSSSLSPEELSALGFLNMFPEAVLAYTDRRDSRPGRVLTEAFSTWLGMAPRESAAILLRGKEDGVDWAEFFYRFATSASSLLDHLVSIEVRIPGTLTKVITDPARFASGLQLSIGEAAISPRSGLFLAEAVLGDKIKEWIPDFLELAIEVCSVDLLRDILNEVKAGGLLSPFPEEAYQQTLKDAIDHRAEELYKKGGDSEVLKFYVLLRRAGFPVESGPAVNFDAEAVASDGAAGIPASTPPSESVPGWVMPRDAKPRTVGLAMPTGFSRGKKKVKSEEDLLTTLLQDGPKGFLKSARFSQELTRRAIKEFGLTTSLSEAGYILPDGSLLDLSGANRGNSSGGRALDHRSVEGLDPRVRAAGKEYRSESMLNFMKRTGAVRFDDYSSFADMFMPATPEQQRVIADAFQDRKEVYITLRSGSTFKDFELSRPDYDEIKRVLQHGTAPSREEEY